MLTKTLTYFLLIFIPLALSAQDKTQYSAKKDRITFAKSTSVNFSKINDDWFAHVQNDGSFFEGNAIYKTYLSKIKEQIEKKYPRKYPQTVKNSTHTFTADTPKIWRNFEGNDFGGSVPNDNNMAISNGNILVSAVNSTLCIFDVTNDTLLKTVSLPAFSDTLSVNGSQFDPKLLYDQKEDRFAITYLAGFTDSTSSIIVGFSQTNDPMGLWNIYELPGNPLSDTSWTDYPAIALTKNELFLTVNLLKNGGSWQTSFKQSVVWQIDKFKGYTGDTLITALWSDIKYNGSNIRNINPIQGGDTLCGPDIYLLSDKNFSLQCDSIFVIHITGTIADPLAQMTVECGKTDKCYGVPPQAHQQGIHTFDTNDARVLGGFIQDNKIQFVLNSVDTTLGSASFYHGFINNLSDLSTIHGNIISDTLLDFGYPNICYMGTSGGSGSSLIAYNHTAPTVFAGSSVIFYDQNDNYSPYIILKHGLNYVNVLPTPNERWGDYSGIQRKYNEQGKAWAATSYGRQKKIGSIWYKITGTWISELASPQLASASDISSNQMNISTYPNPSNDLVFIDFEIQNISKVKIELFDLNGRLIKQLFNGDVKPGKNSLRFSTHFLSKGTYFVKISDKRNMLHTEKIMIQ